MLPSSLRLSHNCVWKMNSYSRNHRRPEQNVRVCKCVIVFGIFGDWGHFAHRCWGALVNDKSSPPSRASDDLEETQTHTWWRQLFLIIPFYDWLPKSSKMNSDAACLSGGHMQCSVGASLSVSQCVFVESVWVHWLCISSFPLFFF